MTSLTVDGNQTIYIRQIADIEYTTDISVPEPSWTVLSLANGCTITNQTTNLGNVKVIFTTDITISNTNQYFICGSSNIQFGEISLKSDGTKPKITVTTNYNGFIQNGTNSTSGYNSIYIYNLHIDGTGYSVQNGNGWIAKQYFAKNATDNALINCSSKGDIATTGGAIVGKYAGSGSGGLFILGCSSTGEIGLGGGGICGQYSGSSGGSVQVEQSFSTGSIIITGGGIFGEHSGADGEAIANNCFSTGAVGGASGGIFGAYCGEGTGNATANNCYSRGFIGTNGGGIFGVNAADSGGTATANNCYSSGTVTTSGNGIFGTSKGVDATEAHCYVADNSWSDIDASTQLQGVPTTQIGTTWVSLFENTPYELNSFGFTPYIQTIMISNSFVQTYSFTVDPAIAMTTTGALDTEGTYELIEIQGTNTDSYNTISLDSLGSITINTATKSGTYTLYVRHVNSQLNAGYNMTQVTLIVPSKGGRNYLLIFAILAIVFYFVYKMYKK